MGGLLPSVLCAGGLTRFRRSGAPRRAAQSRARARRRSARTVSKSRRRSSRARGRGVGVVVGDSRSEGIERLLARHKPFAQQCRSKASSSSRLTRSGSRAVRRSKGGDGLQVQPGLLLRQRRLHAVRGGQILPRCAISTYPSSSLSTPSPRLPAVGLRP